MSVKTVADLANVLSTDRQIIAGVHDTVFRNVDSLIGPIIPLKGYQAGTGVKILVNVSANASAEVYTEGQSAPSRGQQTVVKADFAFKAFRVFLGETGHARRAHGPAGQGFLEGVDPQYEITMASEDLRDLMTTTFLTAAIYGVPGIISDATYNFGDQSRSTYATLISYLLDANSAALSTALVNKASHRSHEAPYGAKVELWVASPLQCGAFAELQSGKVAALQANNEIIPTMILPVEMPDLATALLLGLTDVQRSWGYTSNEVGNLGGKPGSGFHVKYYGAQDDSDTIQLSTAGAIWCNKPNRQVKIHTLSTT